MMTTKLLKLIAFLVLTAGLLHGTGYHVSISGSDRNSGFMDEPFKTISKAAEIALPGDIITVHGGTYRERIDPRFGGTSDSRRIVYRAAENEDVWIKGPK